MEAAYAHAGLDVRYINCEVPPERLEDAVRGAIGMGWLGFNCSIPHKVAILDYLDAMAPSAGIIGAVNCVINRDGHLTGENTDGQGFVRSLSTVVDPSGRDMVVLGAGGAARAIAVESALAGAHSITIVNRTRDRGEELAALVSDRTPAEGHFVAWEGSYAVPDGVDILVNATSIGFFPSTDTPDVVDVSIRPGMVVADVVANPPDTVFLRRAAARGATTLQGLGMLVNQALTNARLWTGRNLDADVMRRALEESLSA
jgi:shikimate dehydrogenase